jgi:hypothetical protein
MNTTPSYLYRVFQSDTESEDEAEIARQEEKVGNRIPGFFSELDK